MTMDNAGIVWLLQDDDGLHPPCIVQLDAAGKMSPVRHSIRERYDANGDLFTPQNQLLVADDGPRQQIAMYGDLATTPRVVGHLGKELGIYADHAGMFDQLKFNRPAAIACDATGNIYVAHHGSTGGGSTVLESYTAEGQLNWRYYWA